MEIITIVQEKQHWIVQAGIAPKSRLYWHSPILRVYILGALPVREFGRVANIALNHQISIGGRAIELERYKK